MNVPGTANEVSGTTPEKVEKDVVININGIRVSIDSHVKAVNIRANGNIDVTL